jgi:alkylated DNA nucleotide flippase Atl1
MRNVIGLVIGITLLAAPVSMHAWGMDVHRWLTRRALDGLPADLKPFFAARRDFISEHAADPDLWRVVGLKNDLGAEDPNHFLDLDALGDPPPFRNVPRDWNAFVGKYGLDRAMKSGRLPWRAEEIYNKLVSSFQDIGKPTGPAYAADNARYLSAVLSHYIEDAHVPFHATANHDGQMTNQHGIHARFETDLVLRNLPVLKLSPVIIHPVGNIRNFVFDTLVESQSLVETVLRADRNASAGREFYDERYFAAFLAGARPVLEKRLSDAASSTASVIVAAWEQAGRPKLPIDGSKPPARIRR